MLSGPFETHWYTHWYCGGSNSPLNLQFLIVCAQKILPKLCSCIYEIQKNFGGKCKTLYSIFWYFASVSGFASGPNSIRPGSTYLDNSWSTFCKTPPLWSPGYAYSATHPNFHPLKAVGCDSPRHTEVTPCWILYSSWYLHKLMSWFPHQNGIMPSKLLSK